MTAAVASCSATPATSRTRTATPSQAATKSVTPSGSHTPAVTPSTTRSTTPSRSITASPSVSPTASRSVTPTPSTTPSTSITPTVTPSSSVTPSVTPSTSVTRTLTVTVTPSRSVSSSVTPTQSVSATVTPSGSVTPSITVTTTVTRSVSVSPTSSCSPTSSLSGSVTPSTSPSRSPSSTVTPSTSASPSRSVTPTNSVTPSISVTSSVSVTPSTSVTASRTPSSSLTATTSASASTSQSASVTVTVTPSRTVSPTSSIPPSASASRSPFFPNAPTNLTYEVFPPWPLGLAAAAAGGFSNGLALPPAAAAALPPALVAALAAAAQTVSSSSSAAAASAALAAAEGSGATVSFGRARLLLSPALPLAPLRLRAALPADTSAFAAASLKRPLRAHCAPAPARQLTPVPGLPGPAAYRAALAASGGVSAGSYLWDAWTNATAAVAVTDGVEGIDASGLWWVDPCPNDTAAAPLLQVVPPTGLPLVPGQSIVLSVAATQVWPIGGPALCRAALACALQDAFSGEVVDATTLDVLLASARWPALDDLVLEASTAAPPPPSANNTTNAATPATLPSSLTMKSAWGGWVSLPPALALAGNGGSPAVDDARAGAAALVSLAARRAAPATATPKPFLIVSSGSLNTTVLASAAALTATAATGRLGPFRLPVVAGPAFSAAAGPAPSLALALTPQSIDGAAVTSAVVSAPLPLTSVVGAGGTWARLQLPALEAVCTRDPLTRGLQCPPLALQAATAGARAEDLLALMATDGPSFAAAAMRVGATGVGMAVSCPPFCPGSSGAGGAGNGTAVAPAIVAALAAGPAGLLYAPAPVALAAAAAGGSSRALRPEGDDAALNPALARRLDTVLANGAMGPFIVSPAALPPLPGAASQGFRFVESCALVGPYLDPTTSNACNEVDNPDRRACAWGEGLACTPCPYEAALCPGGRLLVPLPGWWVAAPAASTPADLVPCLYPATQRCPGGISATGLTACGRGYREGTAGCSACDEGFFPSDLDAGACKPCPSVAALWDRITPVLTVIGWLLLGMLPFAVIIVVVQKRRGGTLKQGFVRALVFVQAILTGLQILVQSRSSSPALPDVVVQLYARLQILQLQGVVTHPACASGASPLQADIDSLSFALALVVLVPATLLLARWAAARSPSPLALVALQAAAKKTAASDSERGSWRGSGALLQDVRASLRAGGAATRRSLFAAAALSSGLCMRLTRPLSAFLSRVLLTITVLLFGRTLAIAYKDLHCVPAVSNVLTYVGLASVDGAALDAAGVAVPLKVLQECALLGGKLVTSALAEACVGAGRSFGARVQYRVLATQQYIVCDEGEHKEVTRLAIATAVLYGGLLPLVGYLYVSKRLRRLKAVAETLPAVPGSKGEASVAAPAAALTRSGSTAVLGSSRFRSGSVSGLVSSLRRSGGSAAAAPRAGSVASSAAPAGAPATSRSDSSRRAAFLPSAISGAARALASPLTWVASASKASTKPPLPPRSGSGGTASALEVRDTVSSATLVGEQPQSPVALFPAANEPVVAAVSSKTTGGSGDVRDGAFSVHNAHARRGASATPTPSTGAAKTLPPGGPAAALPKDVAAVLGTAKDRRLIAATSLLDPTLGFFVSGVIRPTRVAFLFADLLALHVITLLTAFLAPAKTTGTALLHLSVSLAVLAALAIWVLARRPHRDPLQAPIALATHCLSALAVALIYVVSMHAFASAALQAALAAPVVNEAALASLKADVAAYATSVASLGYTVFAGALVLAVVIVVCFVRSLAGGAAAEQHVLTAGSAAAAAGGGSPGDTGSGSGSAGGAASKELAPAAPGAPSTGAAAAAAHLASRGARVDAVTAHGAAAGSPLAGSAMRSPLHRSPAALLVTGHDDSEVGWGRAGSVAGSSRAFLTGSSASASDDRVVQAPSMARSAQQRYRRPALVASPVVPGGSSFTSSSSVISNPLVAAAASSPAPAQALGKAASSRALLAAVGLPSPLSSSPPKAPAVN